jgi:1-acyl-sn-glycerol-3-phosphate acyltransferase
MKLLRAAGRVIGVLGLVMALVPLQLIVGQFMGSKKALPKLLHRGIRNLFNINIDYKGPVEGKRQKIVVSNHLSSMDGFVVGSHFNGAFVAMADMVQWPVIGPAIRHIGKTFDTMFIERTKKYLPQAHYKLAKTLNEGQSAIIFLEGKTTSGHDVEKFHAGLLRVFFKDAVGNNGQSLTAIDRDGKPLVVDRDVQIQPVALRVLDVAGKDATKDPEAMATYCWADTPALKHFWNILSCKGMTLEVTALPPLDPKNFSNPFDLANTAHKMVREVVLQKKLPDPEPFQPKAA